MRKPPQFMKLSVSKPAGPPGPSAEEREAADRAVAKGPALGVAAAAEVASSAAAAAALPQGPRGAPSPLLDRAEEAAASIRDVIAGAAPRIAVVLGSGLGGFADALEGARYLDYAMIPHFPRSTVVGHKGRMASGSCAGVPILAMQGRFHYYEGYALDEVTFPIRVLARLGVRLVVLTNAAGGIADRLDPGDLMLIEDHLNLMGSNPLRGPHDERLGPRFPDMSEVYAKRFGEAIRAACPAGTPLKSGVYAALPGPSYETPAEIRMLARLGADAVGMSTVPEAIVAAQMGMGVAAISGIANRAAGLVAGHRLTHAEVVETMGRIGDRFKALLAAALPALEKAI